MRHHRLSLVRGLLNDTRPTYFVVDTGGEVISISTTTAEDLDHDMPRKIALRVYGTSGWDRDAFLMPGPLSVATERGALLAHLASIYLRDHSLKNLFVLRKPQDERGVRLRVAFLAQVRCKTLPQLR
jgi:hypothetical protein